jgi:hypothetical protein
MQEKDRKNSKLRRCIMSRRSINVILSLVIIMVLLGGVFPVRAADFPAKAVTVIVPWVAGGSTDTCIRVLAESTAKHLGQPVIVENKPGGGGTVADRTKDDVVLGESRKESQELVSVRKRTFSVMPDLRSLPRT